MRMCPRPSLRTHIFNGTVDLFLIQHEVCGQVAEALQACHGHHVYGEPTAHRLLTWCKRSTDCLSLPILALGQKAGAESEGNLATANTFDTSRRVRHYRAD